MKEESLSLKRAARDTVISAAVSGITLQDLCRVGDCPNVEMKTMGGKTFWDVLKVCENGWELQQNKITRLCRILDEQGVRKAWGNRFAMEEKLKRLTRETFLEAGDIIGIERAGGLFEHYAVYIGNDRVIHYQWTDGKLSEPITIHEAPLSEFLKNDEKYFVLLFDIDEKNVIKLKARTQFLEADVLERSSIQSIFNHEAFHLYSAEQTIKRASERLGEEQYNLVLRNCEHFAMWCRIGVSCSFQVKRVLNWIAIIRLLNFRNVFI